MQKISLEETQKFKNSNFCRAIIYSFDENEIDISTATIRGRYPDKGYLINTKVKEIVYVFSGAGEICFKNKTISFKKGDAILIDKGEKYFWNAKCKIVECCTPAWNSSQCIIVD